jgi:2-dehydropantoate 2-reductase
VERQSPVRTAVVGIGGVGGYYGGLLAHEGHEIIFIARGENLRTIRKHGLDVKSSFGDFRVKPALITDRAAEVGPVELILFCTKTYDTEAAAKQVTPMISSETTILSLQNGVEAAERIGAIAGRKHMLAGATWISSKLEAPGVVRQMSDFRRVAIGEPTGRSTARVQAVHDVFRAAGVDIEVSENIQGVLWTKFIFLAAASALGSLTRMPVGAYRHIPETRGMIKRLMREAEAIAHALRIELDPSVVDGALAFLDEAAPQLKASMQVDVEAGRRTELDSIIGVLSRKGRELGVPTPVADLIYAALRPLDLQARSAVVRPP